MFFKKSSWGIQQYKGGSFLNHSLTGESISERRKGRCQKGMIPPRDHLKMVKLELKHIAL